MQIVWDTFGQWIIAAVSGFILAVFILPTKLGEAFFRSKLDRELEKLKAELKAIDDRSSALRKASLEGFGARSATITQRKLLAVENLWNAVTELTPYVTASKMTAPIKWNHALQVAYRKDDTGANTRKFAETYWKILKVEEFAPTARPDRERPFLTETCWARFSLYRSVLTYPVAMLAAMKNGIDPSLINDPAPILAALKQAFPHYAKLIDEYGDAMLPELRDELQALVLEEIHNIVEGKRLDQDTIEQAQRILHVTDTFQREKSADSPGIEIPENIKRNVSAPVISEVQPTAERGARKIRMGRGGKYLPIEKDEVAG